MAEKEIIGRKAEKVRLGEILDSASAEFLVVYGRRRVGKTFLIREYYKNHLIFDFSGAFNSDISTQLSNFFDEYLKRTRGAKETTPPRSWAEAFRYLSDYLWIVSKRKKSVVFIDELPWLDDHKSGFVSALEYFWNQHVSKMDHVALVVSGSASSWIRKKILKSKGGLYNRVTHRIKLRPFTLAEAEAFCKSKKIKLSNYQILELYMVMGGIPYYLKEIKQGLSSTQIIDKVCFQKDGMLYDEYDQLYHSIFNSAENHMAVIKGLWTKPQGLLRKDLVKLSALPDGGITTRTIEELEESGFITIHLPFNKKKRNAIYKIADQYSLFYLKFIKGNKLSGRGTWEKLSNKPTYIAWSGYAFENICFQHIYQIKKALGISGIYTSSSSWKHVGNNEVPGAQIDLLIDRDDQIINICEAKFTKKEFAITKSYAAELRRKLSVFQFVTGTKKSVHTTLLSTYPAFRNEYYNEHIQSEVTMDALFNE